jgi:sec-independent protein translocase protein TatA
MHSLVLGFLNIGSSEMVLIVFVALLLFGGEKLPEIARGLGKGIRDFKDASEGVKREINNQINSYEEKKGRDQAK